MGGTATPSAPPVGTPAASTGGWASLDIPPAPPIAELTGDRFIGAGLDPGSGFTLRSLDGSRAADSPRA